MFFRCGGMVLALLTTSTLIKVLGASNYGVWATLVSLLAWIQLSDFGVGYALKNRIAASSSSDELLDLVSGVFQFFLLVSVGLALVFWIVGDHLKIVRDYPNEARVLYVATFIFFPLTIGTSVLQGLRKTSISSAFGFAQSALWLICVMAFMWLAGSVIELTWVYVATVVMISLLQFIVAMNGLSNTQEKWSKQILKIRNFKLALPLLGIGVRFILLQMSSVVLFSLGTYLTYSNLSAEEAAKFDVMFKFFQVPLTVFSMIISVYWVEIARDISLENASGLTRKYKQLLLMSLGIALLIFVFAFAVMPTLINAYSGNRIQCTNIESITFGALIVVQIFAYSGAVFLNAAEILKGQIALAILAASLLIPVAKYFFGIGFGVVSVPLATAILISPSLIYCNWKAYSCVIKKNS